MKKILIAVYLLFVSCFLPVVSVFAFSNIPSFEKDFANGLSKGSERVYNPNSLWIDSSLSLRENIRVMFYPDPNGLGGWWVIRNVIKVLSAGFFVAMIMYTGIQFIWRPEDKTKIDNAKVSLLHIAYGGFLIFGSAYLIWLLNFEGATSRELVQNLQNNILVNVIAFVKAVAFFFAIVMIFWYGIEMIQALDAEDKRKKWLNGAINVISALVFIKLLDFIFYIAQQQDFKTRIASLFVDISKVIAYVLGGVMLLYIIYAWRLMVMSNGEDDAYKKAANTLKTIFMVILVIFLFLMIVYQLVKDLS